MKDKKVINFYEKAEIPYVDDPETGLPRPITEEEARVLNVILRKFLHNIKYEGRGFNDEEKKLDERAIIKNGIPTAFS